MFVVLCEEKLKLWGYV